MTREADSTHDRNLPLLTGQSTLATAAWMMASPSIVLTFLAVSLDMPVFLIGALVSIRQLASSLTDVFLFGAITRIQNRKRALSLTDLTLALCFGATIIVVLFGDKFQAMVVFVVCIFIMGIVDEFQQLLLTDFISDNLKSHARLKLRYAQMAFGGIFAVALTWAAHELTLELPPLHRHSIIVALGVICFALSAFAVLAVRDFAERPSLPAVAKTSAYKALTAYVSNAVQMLEHGWFRKFVALRIVFSSVVLSVPFFSLISAEAHHASNKGLTALIISYALGYIVAGPLWGALNNVSHRLVMFSCAVLVGVSGAVLAAMHFLDIDHDVRLHAVAIFTVSVAVRGIGAVLSLYYMDIAPKEQRVNGIAVARSFVRVAMICLSAALAAVAHLHETAWAIVFITLASFAAAIISFFLTRKTEVTQAAEALDA
ncbi:MAG: MFS transporter [Pseudomonadota bacterium]